MQGLDSVRYFHIVFHTALGIPDVLQELPQGNRTIEGINSRCSMNWPMHHLLPKLSKTCWLRPSVAKRALLMAAFQSPTSPVTYLLSHLPPLAFSSCLAHCPRIHWIFVPKPVNSSCTCYFCHIILITYYIIPWNENSFFYEYCKECFGKTIKTSHWKYCYRTMCGWVNSLGKDC